MPCPNCEVLFPEENLLCVNVPDGGTLEYGVQFVGTSPGTLPGTTNVTYLVCNCNPEGTMQSGISHINFELCPDAPTPIAAFTPSTTPATPLVVEPEGDDPAIIGFENFKVEGFPGGAIEPETCLEVTLVYTGTFTDVEGVGQFAVKVGGGPTSETNTGSVAGLPIVGCPEEQVCPDPQCDCEEPDNTDSCTVMLEGCLTFPDFEDINDLIPLIRYDFCLGGTSTTEGICNAPAMVTVCPGTDPIPCCVQVTNFTQSVVFSYVLFNVPVVGCRPVDPEDQTLPAYLCCADTDLVASQSCFSCDGTNPLTPATCDNVDIDITSLDPVLDAEDNIIGLTINYTMVLPPCGEE